MSKPKYRVINLRAKKTLHESYNQMDCIFYKYRMFPEGSKDFDYVVLEWIGEGA